MIYSYGQLNTSYAELVPGGKGLTSSKQRNDENNEIILKILSRTLCFNNDLSRPNV